MARPLSRPPAPSPAAALAKGIVAEGIVVENERHAVGGVGLVAHEQAERQVEVMGQVDALVAHHGADLAAIVGVQRELVAAVDVGGRAVEHQVGAGMLGAEVSTPTWPILIVAATDGVPFVLSANNIQ